MQVRIDGHIRGEAIHIVWHEGAVSGDLELVERARLLHHRVHGAPIDETDPVAFITALEQASPEHLEIHVGPELEPLEALENELPGASL